MADKAVPTWYGEFIPKYYEAVHNTSGQSLGVNMYMEFNPGDRVIDAKKFGFIQAVKTEANDVPQTITEHEAEEKTVDSGVGEGYYIDQDDRSKNPLYATGKKKNKSVKNPKDKLEGYEDDGIKEVDYTKKNKLLKKQTRGGLLADRKYSGYGEFGYRYFKSDSIEKKDVNTTSNEKSMFEEKNASFQDTPHNPYVVPKFSQEFETTVVVADGKQKGLYLGSVNWGWERTGMAESDFKKLPFTIKSEGAPSEVFFKSAARWNQAETQRGKNTVDLPMIEGTVLKDQLSFYKKTKEADIDPAAMLHASVVRELTKEGKTI